MHKNKKKCLSNGKIIESCLDKLNFDSCSDFQKKVLKAVSLIPYGETRTYSDIAKKIGNPKACRAVGSALANNPFPIIIPCHRVIRSNGDIGNYQAGRKMKKYLLDLEINTDQNKL